MAELFPDVEREPRVVSLVRLAADVARALADVGRVTVQGEIHRPSRSPGGRTWFTLRDRSAQINVTVPANRASRFRIAAGERVAITGSLEWVNDRGAVNLVADHIAPVGEGAIAAAIADARKRLEADGILTRVRRPLPRLPRLVGVICGSEAAVRKDIESVAAARFPGYPVEFTEVVVSGPAAADNIARAVHGLDRRDDVDVIVVARGGGDAAQLLPFSDEALCRAIAASGTPVVVAIGHEGDRPLCDEVADLRCGTPSMAAAAVIPSRVELEAELARLVAGATVALTTRVDAAERRLVAIDRDAAVEQATERARARLHRSRERLALVHPTRLVEQARHRLERVDRHSALARRVERERHALAARRRELAALDPARVLQRGYAVVRVGGRVVRDPTEVSSGDRLLISVAGGDLTAVAEGDR